MTRGIEVVVGWLATLNCVFVLVSTPGHAATVAEVAVKVKSLKAPERIAYLLNGAQAEGELAYYGTLPTMSFCRWRGFTTRAIGPWRCNIISHRATAFSIEL